MLVTSLFLMNIFLRQVVGRLHVAQRFRSIHSDVKPPKTLITGEIHRSSQLRLHAAHRYMYFFLPGGLGQLGTAVAARLR